MWFPHIAIDLVFVLDLVNENINVQNSKEKKNKIQNFFYQTTI
jgi:hypothetical protein